MGFDVKTNYNVVEDRDPSPINVKVNLQDLMTDGYSKTQPQVTYKGFNNQQPAQGSLGNSRAASFKDSPSRFNDDTYNHSQNFNQPVHQHGSFKQYSTTNNRNMYQQDYSNPTPNQIDHYQVFIIS